MPQDKPRVPKRIAAVIINSLKGGVVPRIGLPYITVGREREIEALLHDLALVADGGASFRFLVGRYGAGKSFLLQTIRTHAMGRDFVVADADLSPERRLQGNQGQGLATYKELIRNLSTKTRPEGGALPLVLERWARNLAEGASDPMVPLKASLAPIRELVHGFDFCRVLEAYYAAYLEGDEPEANDTETYNNGVKVVPSYLLPIETVYKDDIQSVLIDSGYWTADEVAKGQAD